MSSDVYYIYALTTTLKGRKQTFYIGQSIDHERRLQEHKRDAKTGTEDKYRFIREVIEPAGATWSMEVLHTITASQLDSDVTFDDYEDFEIIRHHHLGHPLQNMRAGSALRRAELDALTRSVFDLDSPRAVREHKKHLAAQAAASQLPIDPRAAAAQARIDALAERLQADKQAKALGEETRAAKRAAAAKKREDERAAWIAEQQALWAKQQGISPN